MQEVFGPRTFVHCKREIVHETPHCSFDIHFRLFDRCQAREVDFDLRGLSKLGLLKRIDGWILVGFQSLLIRSTFLQMLLEVGDISGVAFLAVDALVFPLQIISCDTQYQYLRLVRVILGDFPVAMKPFILASRHWQRIKRVREDLTETTRSGGRVVLLLRNRQARAKFWPSDWSIFMVTKLKM